MHSLLRKHLHVDLSGKKILIHRSKGFLRKKFELIDSFDAGDSVSFHPVLKNHLQSRLTNLNISHLGTDIIISDACVRYFKVTPPRNIQSLQDCRLAAEVRFRNLYEEDLSAWTLQADLDANADFMVCAVPNALLEALQEVATDRRLVLHSIKPKFISVCNQRRATLKKNGWFCVVSESTVSIGLFLDGRLFSLRVIKRLGEERRTGLWMREQFVREALLLNLHTPSDVMIYGDSFTSEFGDETPGILVKKIEENLYQLRFTEEALGES
ncbi:hypothetical protein D3C72_344580 [compost metagenome]